MIKTKNSGYQFSSTTYSVKEVLNGKDILTLTIPAKGEDAQHALPEVILVEKAYSNSEFVIKSINGDDDETEITAELNLDDFNSEILEAFNKTGNPYNILNTVVPKGWTVEDRSGIRSSKTVDLEAPTAEEVADSVINVFGVAIRYDFEQHLQIIYDPSSMKSNGEYVTKELNLVSLSRYQSSYDLRNRLYAYGKDGLSFADINDGKPYVDDTSYLKGRIRCYRVKDDRFTNKESLLEFAKSTLKAMSKPISSYECTPADIGATDARYAFLKLELMSVVTLLDVDTNTRVDHQVVNKTVWPYDRSQNSLTLSASSPSFTGKLTTVEEQIQNQSNTIDKKIEDYVDSVTDQILTASGGHVIINYGDDGKMAEILLMDTTDKATAVNVMRFNMGGIAFSTSGYNGPFNGIMGLDGKWFAEYLKTWQLSASIIIAGILQSHDGETFYLDLEKGILRMKATSFTVEGKTIEDIAAEEVNGISLGVTTENSYTNILEDAEWTDSYGGGSISDGILTITGSSAEGGASMYVPTSNLSGLAGKTLRITFEYKVTERFGGGFFRTTLWYVYQTEPGGGAYKNWIEADVVVEPTEDWTKATIGYVLQEDVVTKLQFNPRVQENAYGAVQVRNVQIEAQLGIKNSITLSKDGIQITSASLDEIPTIKDFTSLKLEQDKLSLTVVKDGEVRSKFAADDTSVTIESGVITFASNTLVVESDNFHLDKSGNVQITGSFYSKNSNGNSVNLADGIASFYARDSSGESYPTTIITRTAGANPCGCLDVYGRSANGDVNAQVRLMGSTTDGSIHLYNAFGTEQAYLTSGESSVSWLAGGLDVRGQHGVQAYYGSIGSLAITNLGVNGGAIQKVYWKWDPNLGAYVLSTSQ